MTNETDQGHLELLKELLDELLDEIRSGGGLSTQVEYLADALEFWAQDVADPEKPPQQLLDGVLEATNMAPIRTKNTVLAAALREAADRLDGRIQRSHVELPLGNDANQRVWAFALDDGTLLRSVPPLSSATSAPPRAAPATKRSPSGRPVATPPRPTPKRPVPMPAAGHQSPSGPGGRKTRAPARPRLTGPAKGQVARLAAALGSYPPSDRGLSRCPSCRVQMPAGLMAVQLDHTGKGWRCTTCGARGNVLDFLAQHHHRQTSSSLSKSERTELEDELGLILHGEGPQAPAASMSADSAQPPPSEPRPDAAADLRDSEPSKAAPGTEQTSHLGPSRDQLLSELRDFALDYRDARQDRDMDSMVDALSDLLGLWLEAFADPTAPPREIVAALNAELGERHHIRVTETVLRDAFQDLAAHGEVETDGRTVTIELSRGETSATWTIELTGNTAQTAALDASTQGLGGVRGDGASSRPAPWKPLDPPSAGAGTAATAALGSSTANLTRPPLTSPLTTSLTASTRAEDGARRPTDWGSEALPPLHPGTVVGGKAGYRLLEPAGAGGMGQVWRAMPLAGRSQQVALKTFLRPEPSLWRGLERELRILRSLQRSDLFPLLHDAIEDLGRLFIVMDWVPGTDLERYLKTRPENLASLGRQRFLDWMAQVAECLRYLHSWQPQPIVFRDLKPANVMLDKDAVGSLRLIDFGISHRLDPKARDAVRRGTRGYVAPEIRDGHVDARADVFGMGRLGLFLLFGHSEFDRIDPDSLPVNSKARGVGPALVRACLALCHERPQRRPSSALEALDGLRNASDSKRGRRTRRRTPWSCSACEAELLRDAVFCPRCGVARNNPGKSSTRGAVSIQASQAEELAAAGEVEWRRLDAFRQLVEVRASADLSKLRCLGHIDVQPYPYQQEAAVQVLRSMNGRALIADDVGLGKTIEAGLIVKEYLVRGLARRCLIISPPGLLLRQLQGEFESKFNLEFLEYRGNGDDDPSGALIGRRGLKNSDLVIVSSHTLRREQNRREFAKHKWDIVVLDECHHIRDHTKLLSKAVRSVSAQSDYRLFLSATPFSGKVDELWAVYNALEPGRLGASIEQFHRRFCTRKKSLSKSGRAMRFWEPLPDKIRAITQRLTIRRRRRDLHVRFPGRTATHLALDLGEFADLYADFAEAVCSSERNGLTRSQLFLQFCSSFESLQRSKVFHRLPDHIRRRVRGLMDDRHPKVRVLLDRVLPRLPEDEQVLVFSRFRASQESLERILRDNGYDARGLIHRNKMETVAAFRRGDFRILVVGAGAGEGLNLQFCSVMINFDLPWNPMRIEQRIGRIQRLGQRRREVAVLNLAAKDTVEDRVLELLQKKLELFRNLQGETEQILGELLEGDASLEGWLAEMLLADGRVSESVFRKKASEIDQARQSSTMRHETDGAAADALLGAGLVEQEDTPRTDEPELLDGIDLSFLDDIGDDLGAVSGGGGP